MGWSICVNKDTNGHLLSQKIAQILPFGGSYIAVILVTALIGGIIGGMGALTGSFLRTPPPVGPKKNAE